MTDISEDPSQPPSAPIWRGQLSLPIAALWLWRWRWLLVASTAIFVLLASGLWLFRGDKVATAMLKIPGGAASPYGAIAAQFGVAAPSSSQVDPVDFYVQLLDTRALLTQVIHSRYRTDDNRQVPYAAAFGIQGNTPSQTDQRAVSDLRKRIGASSNSVTSTITLSVTARSGLLAEQVARAIVTAINDFNVQRRQSSARNERRFAEDRLVQARAELRASQDELEQYAISNKAFSQSASQQFHTQRLQAEIDIRQRLVAMLEQAFEQAKLDEVRDTPVITEIDSPEGSATRKLSLPVMAAIGAVLGLVGGFAIALIVTLGSLQRYRYPVEWAEMKERLPALPRRRKKRARS
jgi:uncharacterized protein involved in exopolysaccharide biosynthesis